jgi:hypothetical protein
MQAHKASVEEPPTNHDGSLREPVRLPMLRDHGPRVPEDELNAIFEPLFLDSRALNNVDGRGLGLTIARRIIVAHLVLVYMPHERFGGQPAGVRDRYSLRQKNQSVSATPNLPPWWLLHIRRYAYRAIGERDNVVATEQYFPEMTITSR